MTATATNATTTNAAAIARVRAGPERANLISLADGAGRSGVMFAISGWTVDQKSGVDPESASSAENHARTWFSNVGLS
jgi:hypothetical protein